MGELTLEALFALANRGNPNHVGAGMTRIADSGQCVLLDHAQDVRASCLFWRGAPGSEIFLTAPAGYSLSICPAGGWLISAAAISESAPAYWFPVIPTLRRLNAQGHILEEAQPKLTRLDVAVNGLGVSFAGRPDFHVDCVAWRIADAGLAAELGHLLQLESKPVFLWGSHTNYARPADVYRHLIHGWVYENRFAWPFKRKICSENDAHALHVTLSGLELATGKRLYALLKAQLVLAVLARMGDDGGLRHGEWTELMESHYRLACSGLHLLMDAAAQSSDRALQKPMARLAEFLSRQHDGMARDGVWFLHDELEHSAEKLRQGPFHWVASRAFGKSTTNMLVLNTQLDTTVGLDRFREVCSDSSYADIVTRARHATGEVLAARSAQWLYQPLFALIRLTMLPTAQAANLPVWQRALKRITWKYLIPRLPDIKARFPRLVMPGGYVDRELSVRTWAHHYLTVNIMDLARHQRRFPEQITASVIASALAFIEQCGIVLRWKELKYEKYALGFWAEALYHLCRLAPNGLSHRKLLAEAMLHLHDLGMGMPPSLLGANAEAVAPALQVPCPIASDPAIAIANLGDVDRVEFLVVNTGDTTSRLSWSTPPAVEIGWQDLDGQVIGDSGVIPPRGAQLGTGGEHNQLIGQRR
ncbi:MAG: hypothetical protein HYX63_00870 [Gammaproteobacteria bacterium]|nr:hypothetical protein [Gammaproteobacteria bacterium]